MYTQLSPQPCARLLGFPRDTHTHVQRAQTHTHTGTCSHWHTPSHKQTHVGSHTYEHIDTHSYCLHTDPQARRTLTLSLESRSPNSRLRPCPQAPTPAHTGATPDLLCTNCWCGRGWEREEKNPRLSRGRGVRWGGGVARAREMTARGPLESRLMNINAAVIKMQGRSRMDAAPPDRWGARRPRRRVELAPPGELGSGSGTETRGLGLRGGGSFGAAERGVPAFSPLPRARQPLGALP